MSFIRSSRAAIPFVRYSFFSGSVSVWIASKPGAGVEIGADNSMVSPFS
ncbi:hypothetical protein [Chryseobacterium gambrini]|nr:hypothetical protein [Chryseobacterium gambrini]